MKQTIFKPIAIITLILILTSCASSEKTHFKIWDNYKHCSAYE